MVFRTKDLVINDLEPLCNSYKKRSIFDMYLLNTSCVTQPFSTIAAFATLTFNELNKDIQFHLKAIKKYSVAPTMIVRDYYNTMFNYNDGTY